MIAVLRQRNFALLWFGQLISSLGDWVLWIALPFFVYEKTGSALATGAMFVIQSLPPILFGSIAGVFVDRWDRKWTMVVADSWRGLVLLLLLMPILFGIPRWLWVLYPIAFVDSTIAQFFKPAKSALIPILLTKEELMAANRLTSLSGDLSMMIGPAVGGVLVGVIGMANVIVLDVLSFFFSAAMIYFIQVPFRSAGKSSVVAPGGAWVALRSIWQEWTAGFQLVRGNRLPLAIFTVMGVAMFGQGILSIAWVIFVKQNLHGGPFEYGIVQVAVAIGGIVGALLLGHLGRVWKQSTLLAIGGMLTGLLLFCTFNLPYLQIILGLQLFGGIAAVSFFVTMETLLQSTTAKEYLGRIFGAFNTTSALLLLGGQGLATALISHLDILYLLDGTAGFYFLSGVVALLLLHRASDEPTSRLNANMAEYQN